MNDRQFCFFFCEKGDAQNKRVHLVYQDNPVESSVGYFIYLHKDGKPLGMSLIISLLILLQQCLPRTVSPENVTYDKIRQHTLLNVHCRF